MPAAADRNDLLAGDLDFGVAIPVPLPALRGAYAIHDFVFEDLRQRPLPQTQQRQREAIDAHVVVVPERAWFLLLMTARFVNRRRLLPQPAFPFTGLLQQVVPGYFRVMRRIEAAVDDELSHRLVQIFDHPAIKSQSGDG